MFKSILICLTILLSGTVAHTQLGLGGAGGEVTPSGFAANAVDFDGTNDSLDRGADLTGAVDDQQGVISLWFRIDSGDGSFLFVFDTSQARIRIFKSSSNSFEFDLKNSSAAFIVFDINSPAITAGADWHHFLWGWDISVPTCQLYIDDVDEPLSNCIQTDPAEVDGTQSDWFLMRSNTGGSRFNGCAAEVYYHQTTYLDFDTESNRRLFNDGSGGSAGGKPVDLGSDGSTPTSSQPIIYLNGDNTNFQTNQGSGGNFNVEGSLAACSTSPSD